MQTFSKRSERLCASLGEGHSFIALRFGTCNRQLQTKYRYVVIFAICNSYLERIAHRKVQTLNILESAYIEEARLASVVWHMQTYAPVNTDNEEVEIIAKA